MRQREMRIEASVLRIQKYHPQRDHAGIPHREV
jgi:hypothetical protein